MPDIATHRQKGQHNQQVIAHLQMAGDIYLDWVITAMFYTALHLVDQVLYHNARLNPRSHRERHAAIGQQSALAPVYRDYRELERQSRRSRYDCADFTPQEVQRLAERLARIEQLVESLVPRTR
jgi:hypothetical protein